MVRIDKNYVFERAAGPVTLCDLLDSTASLSCTISCLNPSWEGRKGCKSFAALFFASDEPIVNGEKQSGCHSRAETALDAVVSSGEPYVQSERFGTMGSGLITINSSLLGEEKQPSQLLQLFRLPQLRSNMKWYTISWRWSPKEVAPASPDPAASNT